MSEYASLADEIERACNDHINSFGTSPKEISKKRSDLEKLLRNDVCTIIEALRLAASTLRQGEPR